MKELKPILLLLFIVTQQLTYSQSQNTIVKTQIELEGTQCSGEDGILRAIEIQLFYNNSFNVVKKIESKKCQDLYVVPKYVGKYKALITVEEYIAEEVDFEIRETSDTLFVKTILFKKDTINNLDEVVVRNVINNPIKIEGNKTTFSVTNNDLLNNGTALETIQRLPGVMTDISGNITLKNRSVTIFIDGLPTNLGGQDLTNYLNSISSSTVSKVEIINNPGASFDANTTADVINVVTTQKNKRGINGTAYAGLNVYRREKYQGSLSLNGLYHKTNWNLALGYSEVDYENGAKKTILNKTENDFATDDSFNDAHYRPFNLKTGIAFPIENNIIDIRYSFFNFTDRLNNTSTFFSDNNSVLTEQISNGNLENKSMRNEITTTLLHKFKKPEQTFTLSYQFYNFNRDVTSNNNSLLNGSAYTNSADNGFQSNFHKLRGDLTIPMELFRINTGFKIGSTDIVSKGIYNNSNSGTSDLVFDYHDANFAVYSEFFKKYNNFDFTVGIRYESIQLESKTNADPKFTQKFNNFFPSFNASYNINSMTGLNLSYSRKVRLPGYQELDPNVSGIFNDLITDGGNPFLKPSFSNNVEFKFHFLSAGYVSLTYSKADIENFAVIVKEDGAYKQTIEQFENIVNYGASFGMPFPLGIITKGMAYTRTIKDINAIDYIYFFSGINYPKYTKAGYDNDFKSLYYVGASSQFVLPYESKFNLNYTYTAPGNYTIYNLDRSFYRVDLVLSKSLFKKSTKIQFSVNDLFNSANGINGSLNNNTINLNLRTYSDTQRIKFALTYNFGTYKAERANIREESDERENKKSSFNINN